MTPDLALRNPADLRAALAQMLNVLAEERQALSGLDMDAILGCAVDKAQLCTRLEGLTDSTLDMVMDEECRGMADAARRMNEANRRVRNLIAANVSARLDALTGAPAIYRARAAQVHAHHARTARAR